MHSSVLTPLPVAARSRWQPVKTRLRPVRQHLGDTLRGWRYRWARRIILGSAGKTHPGWLATDIRTLDITRPEDFARYWRPLSRRAFLAEHVWEHLTPAQGRIALVNCWNYLRPGGYLRLAVPDGFHPDPVYLDHVRPNGPDAHGHQHQVLYNYQTLSQLLHEIGFVTALLEYWDEHRRFHAAAWSVRDGFIERSLRFDPRNSGGQPNYTSLIIDAHKCLGREPRHV